MINIYDYYITPEEYSIAASNGIDKANLDRRIRRLGWSKERALKEPIKKNTKRDRWLRIALENSIKKSTFFGRINRLGWSEEKAATTPVVRTAIRNRKYSDELYNTLEKNGISKSLFYDRIRKGWDIERASTEHVYSNKEKVVSLKNCKSHFRDLNNVHWKMRVRG